MAIRFSHCSYLYAACLVVFIVFPPKRLAERLGQKVVRIARLGFVCFILLVVLAEHLSWFGFYSPVWERSPAVKANHFGLKKPVALPMIVLQAAERRAFPTSWRTYHRLPTVINAMALKHDELNEVLQVPGLRKLNLTDCVLSDEHMRLLIAQNQLGSLELHQCVVPKTLESQLQRLPNLYRIKIQEENGDYRLCRNFGFDRQLIYRGNGGMIAVPNQITQLFVSLPSGGASTLNILNGRNLNQVHVSKQDIKWEITSLDFSVEGSPFLAEVHLDDRFLADVKINSKNRLTSISGKSRTPFESHVRLRSLSIPNSDLPARFFADLSNCESVKIRASRNMYQINELDCTLGDLDAGSSDQINDRALKILKDLGNRADVNRMKLSGFRINALDGYRGISAIFIVNSDVDGDIFSKLKFQFASNVTIQNCRLTDDHIKDWDLSNAESVDLSGTQISADAIDLICRKAETASMLSFNNVDPDARLPMWSNLENALRT